MRPGFAILLSSVLATAACTGKSGSTAASADEGKVAPRFTGKTVEGEYLALEDLRGKVVLLNVWATWCAPCRQELPELARLHREHEDQGFTVLGVSVDNERDFQKVRQAKAHYRLQYPIVLDPRGTVVSPFGVRGYPTTFLLGRDGTILWRRDGLIHKNDRELAAQMNVALAEPVPTENPSTEKK